MFEEFSNTFESGFRIFFMVWVSFWGLVNIVSLLVTYATFDSLDNAQLTSWFINAIAQVITVTLGVFLLFLMASIPARIKKLKPITNTALITTIVVGYYLVANILNVGSSLINKPDDSARVLIFNVAWIFPSIILLVIHILYVANLRVYNESLNSDKNQDKAAV